MAFPKNIIILELYLAQALDVVSWSESYQKDSIYQNEKNKTSEKLCQCTMSVAAPGREYATIKLWLVFLELTATVVHI